VSLGIVVAFHSWEKAPGRAVRCSIGRTGACQPAGAAL